LKRSSNADATSSTFLADASAFAADALGASTSKGASSFFAVDDNVSAAAVDVSSSPLEFVFNHPYNTFFISDYVNSW